MDFSRFIFDQAKGRGIPPALANLVVAQARHETADYTSNVFKSCKNFFGYKYVGQSLAAGSCLQAPEGGKYAAYKDYADSVRELTDWIRRRQTEGLFPKDLAGITTAEQYSQLLKKAGYYGDPVSVYTAGLLRFAVNYGAAIAFGGVVVLAILVYYLSRK